MVKSPVEYFEAQTFEANTTNKDAMSSMEKAFIQKYMGIDAQMAFSDMPVVGEEASAVASFTHANEPMADLPMETETYTPLDNALKEAESVQLVSFFIAGQLYALPTLAIQEVIRRQEASLLPMAPSFVSGVINLRGHVTPLISLRGLLDEATAGENEERFTIICRCQGMQFGMQIDQLQTMYRVVQKDLNWNAEASVGGNVDFITGLFEVNDKLIPIISIDRLVDAIFKE